MVLIRSEIFSMDIKHLRALMQRFAHQHAHAWEASSGQQLGISEYRHTRRELVGVTEGLSGPFGNASPNRHYREVDTTPPTRASWEVSLLGSRGYAGIEAYELPDKSTEVQFFDGYYPQYPGQSYPPIGEAFEEFCKAIAEEMQAAAGKQSGIPDPPDIEHASPDEWFDWYYIVRRAGSKITLEKLSSRMGLSYNYVRKLHRKYKAQKAQNTPQK